MHARRQTPVADDEIGLGILSPLLTEGARALGWVAAQALMLVHPLLVGWGNEEAVERIIRWLEAPVSPAEGRQE